LRAVRGEADAATSYPQDGVVSLTALVGYLKTRVAFEASRSGWTKSITPQPRDLRTSDGEFFFLTNESKVAKLEGAGGKYQDRFENGVPVVVMGSAPPPACDRDADRLFWEAIKNETAPRYFEAYLRRVASGELCGLFAEVAHLKSEANIAALPSATGSKPEQPAEPDPAIDEAALNLRPEHRRTIQQALTAIGLYADGIDGIFGANTRQAIASWQRDKNEKPTGYLTAPQYGQLLAEAEPKRAALESARQESERTSPSSRPSARAQFGKPGDGGLKSGSSTTEVFVKFVNVTEQTISIYWIDFQGQEKIYYRLRPNAEYVQQTYTTHVWIAKDPLGEILSTFVANDGDLQPTVVVR
jgi:hypothetical protein